MKNQNVKKEKKLVDKRKNDQKSENKLAKLNQHRESVQINENIDYESEEIKIEKEDNRVQSASSNKSTELTDASQQQTKDNEKNDPLFASIVDSVKQEFWELQVLHNIKKKKVYICDKGLYKIQNQYPPRGLPSKPSEFKEMIQMFVPLGNYLDYIELDYRDNTLMNDDAFSQFSSIVELNRSIKHLELNFKLNKTLTEQAFQSLIIALENCHELETLILIFTENDKFTDNNLQRMGQMLKKLIRLVNLELDFGNNELNIYKQNSFGNLTEAKRQQFCKILQKEKPIPNLKFKFGFFEVKSYQDLLKKECNIF